MTLLMRRLQGLRALTWQQHLPILCLCTAVAAGLSAYWRTHPPAFAPDEWDIVRPALKYMAGDIATHVKHPSFSYYFYGIFMALTGTLHDEAAALEVARNVTATLFVCNLLLHYVCARHYLAPHWAAAATAGLVGMPWVLFTAIVVKTEGLQLTAVLLALLAHQRLDASVRQRRWFVLAAIAAAVALATKLNLLPLAMMVFHTGFRALRGNAPFTRAELLVFACTFALAIPMVWTNLWVFPEIVATTWRDDVYFRHDPIIFSCLDALFALPHGRFASFLVSTLPLSLGYFSLFWIGAIALRSGGVSLHVVFGGATAAVLVAGLLATCMRAPHPFSPYTIYFHLAGWCFLQGVVTRYGAGRPWLPRIAGSVLMLVTIAQLLQSITVPKWPGAWIEATAAISAERSESPHLFAVSSLPTRGRDRVATLVAQQSPHLIHVSTVLFEQLAKYPPSAGYDADRAFYAELVSGKLPYRLRRSIAFPMPFSFLSLDSQYREASFLTFERVPR
jgi:hypothetical protein